MPSVLSALRSDLLPASFGFGSDMLSILLGLPVVIVSIRLCEPGIGKSSLKLLGNIKCHAPCVLIEEAPR